MTGLLLKALPGPAPATELPVRASPGASRDALAGVVNGALKVRISAPPVEGAANERLLRFLAKEVFSIPVSSLTLVAGERGRDKRVRVPLAADEVERLIADQLVHD